MEKNQKKVMVFGVFDGLHDGHRFFLENTSALGNALTIVVAQDETAKKLKGCTPQFPLSERIERLKKEYSHANVIAGDQEEAKWNVIETHKPDIIALGYDQNALEKSLEAYRKASPYPFEITKIAAFKPDKMHSRFLKRE